MFIVLNKIWPVDLPSEEECSYVTVSRESMFALSASDLLPHFNQVGTSEWRWGLDGKAASIEERSSYEKKADASTLVVPVL